MQRKDSSFGLPRLEKEILAFWEREHIFEKSVRHRRGAKRFVFYEGPPSANAPPGVHHVLARAYKDVICRYKTVRGYLVERKAGWDTHGLPIELAAEKEIGINSKKEIESYGVEKFNRKARSLVWKYKQEWDALTRRIGFWLDLENPYITYETSYIESVWWIIKQIWKEGRLYRDDKVVPYCPRCGTALSSHEVAQEYQRIREDSIILRFKARGEENVFFLVWTTTPWTLPANVALAVHPDFLYSKVRLPDGSVGILAQALKDRVAPGAKEIGQISGKLLMGMEYEPIFQFIKPDKPAYRVVGGTFVSAEEGTGIVHIAPAFGIEDMEVGRANDLPTLMTVTEEGVFVPEIRPWAGMFVKKADPLIVKALREKNALYALEPYEHDYPFCWRCKTPLLYYAKRSWFIRMQDLRETLIRNNERIHWEPGHLKMGRFGGWLSEIKDWTFSRERYWGTPLPIWMCEKCGRAACIGRIADFSEYRPRGENHYFTLRHGESVKNKKGIMSSFPERGRYPLTPKGRKQVKALIPAIRRSGIELIIASDLLRTRETAALIGQALKIPVSFDARLRELDFGTYNGKRVDAIHSLFSHTAERFSKRFPEGENWRDVRARMAACIRSLEERYAGKRILIVSHADPLWMLTGALKGLEEREMIGAKENPYPRNASLRPLHVPYAPIDGEGMINLHRPFVDRIPLRCNRPECGGVLRRVPEVIDVWFDSGAMPFAQWHYPMDAASVKKINGGEFFPADFIAEGIDQTRGWFYTLLAVSTLLAKGPPYRNVISLGHVLDANGEAMHKSKGNIIYPRDIIHRYGSDALRWYYFTANAAGETKRFDENELQSRERRFLATLWHISVFFHTYVSKKPKRAQAKSPLDSWIYARIAEAAVAMQTSMDQYDVPTAARTLDGLLDDVSNWYVRRSRDAFQRPRSPNEHNRAAWHLRYVLLSLAKLSAPFIPFLSEAVYRGLRERKPRSVHLTDYPLLRLTSRERGTLGSMKEIRRIVRLGLAARKRSGIKIRQPMKQCIVRWSAPEKPKRYEYLIRGELNVKGIRYTSRMLAPRSPLVCEKEDTLQVCLDASPDPRLEEEGEVREFVRQIQNTRKRFSLRPQERAKMCVVSAPPEITLFLERWKKEIGRETRVFVVHRASHGKKWGRRITFTVYDKKVVAIFLSDDTRFSH